MSLRAFKQLSPEIPTAIIWSSGKGVPWYMKHGEGRWISSCDYLKPIHTQATRTSITLLGSIGGRPVVPWTVDDPSLAKDLIDRGCAGIITNRPQDLASLLG
jgi:glycerophosphoryl diester phosphodiesterase